MSETNTIKGTVETVLDLQEFASGFCKRVLVINTGGDYPQTIPVEFVKDKVEILTGLRKGQEVEAFVDLRGNEYNGKYYANIQGWKLDKGNAPSVKKPAPSNPVNEKGWDEFDKKASAGGGDDSEEIPFRQFEHGMLI